MSEDSVEINGLDIKPYIISQRNCRPAASGYVMEPINSNLIIDLNSFTGNIKASIFFKRISGNGKAKINDIYTDVLSKESHQIDLDIIVNKKIEILREQDSIGKIIITNIKIINVKSIDDKYQFPNNIQDQSKTLKDYSKSWKNLLIKSGNVRGIKLINDRLYASEGAQIQHANIIESLETEPPQSFVISDVIKFVFACEIKSAYFKSEFQTNVDGVESKFKHFNKPPIIKTNSIISNNIPNNVYNTINNMNQSRNSNIIYDSFISGLKPGLLINSKDIIINQGKNNSGLLLKREAGFSIPISELKPNMQYVIVANLKKISGNGKFGVAISTTDREEKSSTIVIAPDRETELYIKLNTESPPTIGNSYVLKVFRPEDSTVGDVLLEQLRVIQGITLASNYINNAPQNIIKNINSNNIKINKTNDADPVRATSKQYSRRASHTKTEPRLNFNGSVCVKNTSAINWFSKIKPLCSGLNIKNDSNVVFGELGSLSLGEKIWVDPFNDSSISEEDNLILSKANVLISPSLQNTELFKKLYPNIQVHLLERAWPLIETTPIKYPAGDYVVMIHRTKEITDKVISSYDQNNPPLVIIGVTDPCPSFVIPMNEYVSYDKMLGVVLNSKFLIDINPVDDYMSGVLSIAFDSGLPVLTSNWFGLGKNNCKFITDKKEQTIKIGIEDCLNLQKINTTENHNAKLDKFLSVLFK